MADEPSASELERLIERNHRETSADILDLKSQLTANVSTIISQFDRYVLAAVYEAREQARDERDRAQDERIKKLEDAAEAERKHRDEEAKANRRMYKTAIITAVLSVVAMVVGSVIVSVLVKSGAK